MSISGMYLVFPLIAFGAVAGLAAVLRWTFDSDLADVPMPADLADFGLLRPVATVEDGPSAGAVRALLADAGIRATVADAGAAGWHVLVFEAELDRARRLVGGAI